MAAHRVDLGDEGDLKIGIGLCNSNSGTQTGAARTYYYDVCLDVFHIGFTLLCYIGLL
jgi:hypothetical protein